VLVSTCTFPKKLFPKRLRLLSAADYKPVFARAEHKVSCKELLILCRANGLDHPRLGLVVAKKHCRLAVQRNRIKRQIRETYRQNQHSLAGFDYVVLAKSGTVCLENPELRQVLNKQWNRILKRTSQSH